MTDQAAEKTEPVTKKPNGTKAKPMSKTALVRSLPKALSAKEVVAKAKEKGIVLSEAYVYKIRSDTKKPKVSAKAPAKAKGQGKSVKAATSAGAPSAADFVRALPAGTSAKDAVKKAKAAGVKLTTGYYYMLKSSLGLSARKGAAKTATKASQSPTKLSGRKTSAGAAASHGLTLTSRDPHEQAVVAAAEALGVERLRAVLDAVERLHAS